MQRTLSERSAALRRREDELAEQYRQKEAALTTSNFEQRQRLLEDLDRLRCRDIESKQSALLSARNTELEDGRLRLLREQVEARRLQVEEERKGTEALVDRERQAGKLALEEYKRARYAV